jgi:hypothetical protein
MSAGLDQYLANQLTEKGILEVVTDPKLADAFFTDSVGQSFESSLAGIFPPPPPPAPSPAEPGSTSKTRGTRPESPSTPTDPNEMGAARNQRISSFTGGKGNVFLVDLKSRSVVWSTHMLPKNRSVDAMDRVSGRIIDELRKDLAVKKK